MTKAEISAFMAEMGRKGGLIGGKRRLDTMTPAERSACASQAARARWVKPRTTDQRRVEWSLAAWPSGTTFAIYFQDGTRMTNCVISRYTAARVYWFKPEYDGDNRNARRHRLDDFKADVANGTIRKSK
jgi:hypothetical protein